MFTHHLAPFCTFFDYTDHYGGAAALGGADGGGGTADLWSTASSTDLRYFIISHCDGTSIWYESNT